MNAKIIAVLLSDDKARIKWRMWFQYDGVRIFWFDEQEELETFLSANYPDVLIIHLDDMNRKFDMQYMNALYRYAVSDDFNVAPICERYGLEWLFGMTAQEVKDILNLIG